MQFAKFLTTLAFAGAALAAAVPAALAKPPAPAQAPKTVAGTGIYKNIKATQATWDRLAAACKSGKKRSVESRTAPPGFNKVETGTFGKMNDIPIGLYTESLVTCLGVAIHGTAPASNTRANGRWLLHLSQASQWDAFEKAVAAEKLVDMQGYISAPSPTALGTKIDLLTWNQEDQDLSTRTVKAITQAVRDLTKKEPIVKSRPMSPSTSMQIGGDNKVVANGMKYN